MAKRDHEIKENTLEIVPPKRPSLCFDSCGLRPQITQGLKEYGFCKPVHFQTDIISAFKTGKDIIVKDDAGTGKTFGAIIALLNGLDRDVPECQFLHVTPYRELSGWTHYHYTAVGKHLDNFTCHACIGGTHVRDEIQRLKQRNIQVVISTSGRMVDMINRKALDISEVRAVVVDELHDIIDYKEMTEPLLQLFCCFEKQVQVMFLTSSISKQSQNILNRIAISPTFIGRCSK